MYDRVIPRSYSGQDIQHMRLDSSIRTPHSTDLTAPDLTLSYRQYPRVIWFRCFCFKIASFTMAGAAENGAVRLGSWEWDWDFGLVSFPRNWVRWEETLLFFGFGMPGISVLTGTRCFRESRLWSNCKMFTSIEVILAIRNDNWKKKDQDQSGSIQDRTTETSDDLLSSAGFSRFDLTWHKRKRKPPYLRRFEDVINRK
jgi:hypothetical protein